MKRNEILDLIKGLARSQGRYGRMYETLMECREDDPEAYEEIMTDWEKQQFKTPLDFILYVEE